MCPVSSLSGRICVNVSDLGLFQGNVDHAHLLRLDGPAQIGALNVVENQRHGSAIHYDVMIVDEKEQSVAVGEDANAEQTATQQVERLHK